MGQIIKICLKEKVFFLRKKKPYLWRATVSPAPYRVKIKIVKIQGIKYAKQQARAHGFNVKKDNLNRPPQPEI